MEKKVDIANKVYKKIYFHCLKYLTDDVFGLIVGKVSGSSVQITDAYPLYHSRITSPTLEIGLEFIENIANENGEKLLGFYESLVKNSGDSEVKISETAHRLYEGLMDTFASNSKLTNPIFLSVRDFAEEEKADDSKLETKVYHVHRNGSDVKFVDVTGEVGAILTSDKLTEDLEKKNYRKVVDFEEHLENPNADFTNKDIK
mmetsp:Transcript_55521/g.63739  ORF Transcript_55521/g.63739 Transcript_55521/m.63739 type:complete len:202 (+) Transcript_55521:45-650(+)